MNSQKLVDVFSNIPTLETERLVLRKLAVSDCFDMYEYSRKPETSEFLAWSPHLDLEYTKAYLQNLKSHYALGMFYDWAVVLKGEDKMIGTCGFTNIYPQNDSAEIGYVINPAYRGRGIAAEAAKRVMEFGFFTLGLNRIEAKYMAGNAASRRVMEKLGMELEGVARSAMLIKGRYADIGICSILKENFESKK